jgi:hypothetical protein
MSALVVIDVLRKLTKLVLSQPTFDAEMRRWWWEKYSKLKAGPAYVPNPDCAVSTLRNPSGIRGTFAAAHT